MREGLLHEVEKEGRKKEGKENWFFIYMKNTHTFFPFRIEGEKFFFKWKGEINKKLKIKNLLKCPSVEKSCEIKLPFIVLRS